MLPNMQGKLYWKIFVSFLLAYFSLYFAYLPLCGQFLLKFKPLQVQHLIVLFSNSIGPDLLGPKVVTIACMGYNNNWYYI